jgi:putative ABC transport system permease protein
VLQNYLTIACRNLIRNRLHTAINVLGLAIGISACLVIYLIVRYEFSFDTFHPDHERIYRVVTRTDMSGETFLNSGVPMPVPAAMRDEIPGIEIVAPFYTYYNPRVSISEPAGNVRQVGKQKGIIFAGPEYFRLFGYEWLSGSPETALHSPHQVVLSEEKVKAYFGDSDPGAVLGREIRYNDTIVATVGGVVRAFTQNSDFTFTEFISFRTLEQTSLRKHVEFDTWDNTNSASQFFLKLSKGTDPAQVNTQLITLADTHINASAEGWHQTFTLQPLRDIHFNPEFETFGQPHAHKPTLYGLLLIALFLLLIACINFINLETAQAIRRAKEVGIRKTLGGGRPELIGQFLVENSLITLLAVLVSLLLAQGAMDYFRDFISSGVTLNVWEPATLFFLAGLTIVVSLLAGYYPAWVISSYPPALAIRNQLRGNTAQSRSAYLRKYLTVFQFTIAQAFIIGTLVIGLQIKFMLSKDMGFEKVAILYFWTPWQDQSDGKTILKNRIEQFPEVAAVSASTDSPASGNTYSSTIEFASLNGTVKHHAHWKNGDTTFLDLYGIPVVAGRNFHAQEKPDEVLINETYAKLLGFTEPEQAIGIQLKRDEQPMTVVGVTADFHLQSLHQPIKPMISLYSPGRVVSLKLRNTSAETLRAVIAKTEAAWQQLYPEEPFDYKFFDETIANFYRTEKRTSRLLHLATGVALFISCLGLFALSSYTVTQRTKEIGIRKVLGASVTHIVALLSRDFLRLILIAFVLAAPLALYAMHRWLEDYAYQIPLKWWMIALPGILALVIAFLTVSWQSIKAALANPVESLRSE